MRQRKQSQLLRTTGPGTVIIRPVKIGGNQSVTNRRLLIIFISKHEIRGIILFVTVIYTHFPQHPLREQWW
jgi:hypothetical protein